MDISRRLVFGLAGSLIASKAFAQATPEQLGRIIPGNVCMLLPQAVEGPFYFDPKLDRADIREDRKGVPLALVLQVVDGATCVPIKDARVDVWHADATGYYSGYDGQSDARNVSTKGKTFLRGAQRTDSAGLVNFLTVYPGWYRGRTAHIHFKVWLDQRQILTGQMYFPDALSEYIYGEIAPYTQRAAKRDTMNRNDFIARQAGSSAFCSIKEEPDRYVASLVIGADRNGKPGAMGPPGGPPPGPPPEPGSPRARGRLVPG